MTVAVVGAGITGLALVHHLTQRSVETVALEAADEPGGVVRSERIDGRIVERGPQRTRLTPAVRELVDAVGLSGELVEAADVPLFVYRDGRLRRVPRSIGEAIRTDLLSTRGKLRALLEPLADGPRSGETVHGYLVRAFGREVAENAAGPIYGGLYGTDPEEMPVDRTLGRALDGAGISGSVLLAALGRRVRRCPRPPAVSFDDGLAALPRALYDRHCDSIRLSTPVRRIDRSAEGVRVETDGGTTTVDHVVITTPAGVAADLLEAVAPDAARALRRLTYNPLAAVTLDADTDLHGAGYQIPSDEPFDTLGSTWADSLLGRADRYTCYLGGGKSPALVDRPDEELGTIAAREFESVTGYPARPVDVHRVRPGMPAFDTTWAALDAVDLPADVHLCTNYTDRAGIPGRVRAARQLAGRLADG